MSEHGLNELISYAARWLKDSKDEVTLIHHNDADGICSAVIATYVLESLGCDTKRICVEKIHPRVLEAIHKDGEKFYVYLDIGSGRADLISYYLRSGKVIIVDHHDPTKVDNKGIVNVNPELVGFSGERDASGSTVSYLLFKSMGEAKRVAWCAVVGSAEIPGELMSLNRIPLGDALEEGDVEIKKLRNKERYYVKFLRSPWDRVSSLLTILGTVAYYEGGPEEAVRSCLDRKFDMERVEKLESIRKERFSSLIAKISSKGMKHLTNIQWFDVGKHFSGMGSKVLGNFTSMITYRSLIDQEKYVIGMMDYEPEVPGLGRIEGEWVKVSVRVPKKLSPLVTKGSKPPASRVLEVATKEVGGTADGHAMAASGLVPKDRVRKFLEILDNLIASKGKA